MDEKLDRQIREFNEAMAENLLDLLFRLERLEQKSGLATEAETLTRLMPLVTSAENDAAQKEIKRRLDILEMHVEN